MSIRVPRQRVAPDALDVGFVLLPRDVARVHIAQQDPLLTRHEPRADSAVGQVALLGATEGEGARIARVVDDLAGTTVQQLTPDEFAFVRATSQAPRERQLLCMELLDDGQARTGALEGLEE